MNKARRQELYEVVEHLTDASDRLQEIRDDEEDAFDSMPDGLQMSIRGDTMQEAVSIMDSWNEKICYLCNEIETYIKPKKK